MKYASFLSEISESHFRVVRSGSKTSCLAFLCPSTVLFRLYLFDTLWIILFYAGSRRSLSLTYGFPMLRIARPCHHSSPQASLGVSFCQLRSAARCETCFLNFQGCITVYLSRYCLRCCYLLNTQQWYTITGVCYRQVLFCIFFILFLEQYFSLSGMKITCPKKGVKKESQFLKILLLRNYKSAFASLFVTVQKINGERGIWTLAPRERPTPLAGAPLQPLEYFSIVWTIPLPIYSSAPFHNANVIIHKL